MTGLRERKKLATHQALSSAALRLAVERGLDNVTIENITAEADVALRTFRNYFASKYEAVAAIGADRARRIGMSLLERPVTEPLWEVRSPRPRRWPSGAGTPPTRRSRCGRSWSARCASWPAPAPSPCRPDASRAWVA